MSLSAELAAFAAAIRNAFAEGAHLADPETWLTSMESHFDAATPAPAPIVEVATVVTPVAVPVAEVVAPTPAP